MVRLYAVMRWLRVRLQRSLSPTHVGDRCGPRTQPNSRTMETNLTDTFDALGLSAPTLVGLGKMGISEPTAVQAQAIPPLLAGRADLVQGLTGSGTHATFVP